MYSTTDILNKRHFEATYTNEFDSDQTSLSIITPTGTKKLKIVGGSISIEGSATTGYVRLSFTGDTVFKAFAGSQTHFSFDPLLIYGGQAEPLVLDSTLGADQNFLVTVNYEEIL